jgi:hypothetical protein
VLRRVLDPYPSGSGIDLSWKFTPEASGNIARARRFSTYRILLMLLSDAIKSNAINTALYTKPSRASFASF